MKKHSHSIRYAYRYNIMYTRFINCSGEENCACVYHIYIRIYYVLRFRNNNKIHNYSRSLENFPRAATYAIQIVFYNVYNIIYSIDQLQKSIRYSRLNENEFQSFTIKNTRSRCVLVLCIMILQRFQLNQCFR